MDVNTIIRLAPPLICKGGADAVEDELFDDIVQALPPSLARVLDAAPRTGGMRLALLQSLLISLSSLMSSVRGVYAGREYSPHHYALISGEGGTGKSIIRYAVDLVRRAGLEVREKPGDDRSDGGAASDLGRAHPVVPPIVSVNASDRGFFDLLNHHGGKALIVATEVDELVGTRRNEWAGTLSTMLRMGFEHEPIRILRKDLRASVEHPRLATILSGTPGQIAKLFPTTEDGLFSRFMHANVLPDPEWHSPRPTESRQRLLQALDELYAPIMALVTHLDAAESLVTITLSDDQWDILDASFSEVKAGLTDSALAPMTATVHRHGAMAFRMAMVLSALRHAECSAEFGSNIEASNEDVMAALMIAMLSLRHGFDVFMTLEPDRSVGLAEAGALRLYDVLPTFKRSLRRSEAVEAGKEIGLSTRTVDGYLKALIELGKLRRMPSTNGEYEVVDMKW